MNKGSEKRYILQGIVLVVALIYLARLFYIQVLDSTYKDYADNNVLHEVTLYPSRGLIFDRNGQLMVYNDAIYDLMVVPAQTRGMDTLAMCRMLGISKEDYLLKMERLKQQKGYNSQRPQVFEKAIPLNIYGSFQEQLFNFPGFFVQLRTDRRYNSLNAAHVLGYIGEISESELDKDPYYKSGDFWGISGIERTYEKELRGKKGVKYVLVDALNREQGRFKNGQYDTLPTNGLNVYATLDAELQAYGEKLMAGKIGSVVAIEPATGEILALVSNPSYDPNLFIGRERGNNYMKLLRDPTKPLFNRALSAPYTPGSTFKVIDALIGLQEGVITPESRFPCGGGYRVGNHTVKCTHVHSALDLRQSLQHSCNPYYCAVFRAIIDKRTFNTTKEGYQNWYDHLKRFGIGRRLEIDLAHEYPGILRSTNYFDKVYGAGRWKSSNIISLSIGQGEVGITPLQMCNVMAIVANKGWYKIPHILKTVGDSGYVPPKFTEKHSVNIDTRHFDVVQDGMQAAVDAGTAYYSRIPGITICGKTGTAQNPHGKDHSLFFCFAPRDTPKIAIAVVIENAGFGGVWAAPIASLMIEKYLTDTVKRGYLEERMLSADFISKITGEKETKPSTEQKEKQAPRKDSAKSKQPTPKTDRKQTKREEEPAKPRQQLPTVWNQEAILALNDRNESKKR